MESVEGVWNSRDSSIWEECAWPVVGAQLLLEEWMGVGRSTREEEPVETAEKERPER